MLQFWKISRKPGLAAERAIPSRLATTSSNAHRKEVLRSTNRAQHIVSKGNAGTLRVHDYRGGQGDKELAKLSVRSKKNQQKGFISSPGVTLEIGCVRRTGLRCAQRRQTRRRHGGNLGRQCTNPGIGSPGSSRDRARSGRQEENHQGEQEGHEPQ